MQRVLLCGCVCLFSSITKVQFGATKSVNRKSTWRSKTCTGKKLRTRRHKMQDESSSNGWVQAANGQEVNADKVPCITHTHTHTQSEVNCGPTHTRPLDVTSAVHLLFYCRSPGPVYVCVWQSVVLGAVPGSRATCLLPFTEPLSSVSLSPSSRSFFRLGHNSLSRCCVLCPNDLYACLGIWFLFFHCFAFHCFTVQRATYTQRKSTELQINKTLLYRTELLAVYIKKHMRSRVFYATHPFLPV